MRFAAHTFKCWWTLETFSTPAGIVERRDRLRGSDNCGWGTIKTGRRRPKMVPVSDFGGVRSGGPGRPVGGLSSAGGFPGEGRPGVRRLSGPPGARQAPSPPLRFAPETVLDLAEPDEQGQVQLCCLRLHKP